LRDPLARVRIQYKLPLTFLAICLVAFGIGGVVLTTEARDALTEQIEKRLDERAAAVHVVVERHLELHGRRAEDFASDGFIRSRLDQLVASEARGDAEASRDIHAALDNHLNDNKLPLVPSFVGAVLFTTDGKVRVASPAGVEGDESHAAVETTAVGDLKSATKQHPYPTFRISTPLRELTGDGRVGTLQLILRADTWVGGMRELAMLPEMPQSILRLTDRNGVTLDLQDASSSRPADLEDPAVIGYRRSVSGTEWHLALGVDRARAIAPAVKLRNQYLLIGLALLLVTAGVLFFPVRFLLKPLSNIAETARKIGSGDLQARVDHDSGDEIGDLAKAVNVMADAIEDRKQRLEEAATTVRGREQDIRLERDRLHAVIHSMEDGLFILDAEGGVTLSNASAGPIVEAFRKRTDESRRLDCKHTERPERGCLGCLSNVESGHQSCVIESNGRIFEVHTTTLPAAPGKRPSRLCVSRDLTERIGLQESQAHQERMSVLGEIAAVMAHELNNPLAAISMFAQMLQKKLEPGTTLHESADVIGRNVKTCKQTISGLLDLAARGSFETAPFDIHDLLDDVQGFLQPILQRARVVLEVHAGAKQSVIVGDEVQLRQVFINLLMNAAQACPAGGAVKIATRDADDRLEIELRDDGEGIPEAVQGRIFEPFFTTKGAGVGTGLGLPTSRRIVREHGGELELHATGPDGTTFSVRLPRKSDRAAWRTEARMDAPVTAGAKHDE